MIDLIFNSIWGWVGVAGIVVIGCVIVGYFIPSLRLTALAVAGAALTVAGAFAKGYSARAKLEAKRKEEAVQKVRKDYEKIENRKDTTDTVSDRLRDNSF